MRLECFLQRGLLESTSNRTRRTAGSSFTNAEPLDALRGRSETVIGELAAIDARLQKDYPDYFALTRPQSFGIARIQEKLGEQDGLLLIRDGRIEQLTEDHSLVNERIRAGLLTPDQARNHKLKNVITRSLGYLEDVEVDIQVRAVRRGDKFLLCSDGLSNLVDPADIGECARAMSPQDACRHLVQLACERGGDDNITTVIARVDEVN